MDVQHDICPEATLWQTEHRTSVVSCSHWESQYLSKHRQISYVSSRSPNLVARTSKHFHFDNTDLWLKPRVLFISSEVKKILDFYEDTVLEILGRLSRLIYFGSQFRRNVCLVPQTARRLPMIPSLHCSTPDTRGKVILSDSDSGWVIPNKQ